MNIRWKTILFLSLMLLLPYGCSEPGLFSSYMKEDFGVTRVSESTTKTVQLLNNSGKDVQHILSITFYPGSNEEGNFQVTGQSVGTEKVSQKDIFVPPMSVLNIELSYSPLNLETTEAEFGGWITTEDDRMPAVVVPLGEGQSIESSDEETEIEPKGALSYMTVLAKTEAGSQKTEDGNQNAETGYEYQPAIHRAMLVVTYDEPSEGYAHIELVGGAIPGWEGESSSVALGTGGDCEASGNTACFSGNFLIDLPGLMSGGGIEVPMQGAIPITIEGGTASINMDEFPPILIVVEGNGPGEPLEGKPVDALSIIISGTSETVITGSFDGQNLSFTAVGFRVRGDLGKLTYDDITPGLSTPLDFTITDINLETEEPFNGDRIIFGADTTLSSAPSGNSLFDAFLGGARVVVKFNGTLVLP